MSDWLPTAAPAQPGLRPPGVGWMLGMSSWLILVFILGGWLAWAGFALIGGLVVRIPWLITAAVYGILTLIAIPLPGQVQMVVMGLLQTAAIIHALILNRTWLTILWGRRERGERMIGPAQRLRQQSPLQNLVAPVRVEPQMPAEAAALFAAPGTNRYDYLAPSGQMPSAPSMQVPAPSPQVQQAPSAPVEPVRRGRGTGQKSASVDVNTATAEQLAALPHMGSERAAYAVSARSRTPFTSTQNFAEVLGLQPHEFIAIRAHITYTPRTKGRATGRRVDL